MAGKKLTLGQSGETVSANVARLRKSAGMNQTELSERLDELGRDIPPLAVGRIEKKDRRVDVDDLVALAVALGVSPITLLMPEADDAYATVAVTGYKDPVEAGQLWMWLCATAAIDVNDWFSFGARAWPTFVLRERVARDQQRAKQEHDEIQEILRGRKVLEHGDD